MYFSLYIFYVVVADRDHEDEAINRLKPGYCGRCGCGFMAKQIVPRSIKKRKAVPVFTSFIYKNGRFLERSFMNAVSSSSALWRKLICLN